MMHRIGRISALTALAGAVVMTAGALGYTGAYGADRTASFIAFAVGAVVLFRHCEGDWESCFLVESLASWLAVDLRDASAFDSRWISVVEDSREQEAICRLRISIALTSMESGRHRYRAGVSLPKDPALWWDLNFQGAVESPAR